MAEASDLLFPGQFCTMKNDLIPTQLPNGLDIHVGRKMFIVIQA